MTAQGDRLAVETPIKHDGVVQQITLDRAAADLLDEAGDVPLVYGCEQSVRQGIHEVSSSSDFYRRPQAGSEL
jgi:hypothetical protein